MDFSTDIVPTKLHMHYRLLSKTDVDSLYLAFVAAFSTHAVKLQPSRAEFSYRLDQKLFIDYDLSGAAFDGDALLGFILHTTNSYQGIPTAYNGGTGVLPAFRNQKIGESLYELLLPKLQAKSVARVILEVVETNRFAIRLYQKVGFHFKRRLLCFKQSYKINFLKDVYNIEESSIDKIDFSFNEFDASFLDNENHLRLGSEKVFAALHDQKIIGYIIFQPHLGRISQMAVAKGFRNQQIGRSLLYYVQKSTEKPLTIMNIPEDQEGFIIFLRRCGFENQVSQFEMELII